MMQWAIRWLLCCLLVVCSAACHHRSSGGLITPRAARDHIKAIIPEAWIIADDLPETIGTAKEYFPDPRVQTLTLIGPQVGHLRWTDHTGTEHVEEWSKECLLLWIVPADFKPKFPGLLDQMAGGTNLPTKIYSSKHVCIYGWVTNSGFDQERFRQLSKEIAKFSIDVIKSSWADWTEDIHKQLITLASAGN